MKGVDLFYLLAISACMGHCALESCPPLYHCEEFQMGECEWKQVVAYLVAWDEIYENVPDMVDQLWIRRYGIPYPEWRADVLEYYGVY